MPSCALGQCSWRNGERKLTRIRIRITEKQQHKRLCEKHELHLHYDQVFCSTFGLSELSNKLDKREVFSLKSISELLNITLLL